MAFRWSGIWAGARFYGQGGTGGEDHAAGGDGGAGRTLYDYDGEGRRAKKVLAIGVTTKYVYDALGRLAAKCGGTAPPAGGRTR